MAARTSASMAENRVLESVSAIRTSLVHGDSTIPTHPEPQSAGAPQPQRVRAFGSWCCRLLVRGPTIASGEAMDDRRTRTWTACLVVAAAIGLACMLYADFVADDVYIAPAFAARTIDHGHPAINPGEPVHAISSPAWYGVALVAVSAARGVGRPDGVAWWMKGASAIGALASGWLMVSLLWSSTRLRWPRWLGLTLFLADPWLWRWAFGGMEAPAALAVALASFRLRLSSSPAARWWAVLLPSTIGVLVRPELALLGAILVGDLIVSRLRPLSGARALSLGLWSAVAIAPVAVWGVFAWSEFGSVVPQTAAAKAGLVSWFVSGWYAMKVVGVAQWASLLAAVSVIVVSTWARRPPPRAATLALLWLAALSAFYVVGGYVPMARYLVPATGVMAWAGAASAEGLSRAGAQPRRWLPQAAAAVGALALAGGATLTVGRLLPSSSGEAIRAYREMARHLEAEAAPEDAVATPEIGTLAYFGRWRLIDTCGLILPEDEPDPRVNRSALLRATRPEWSTFEESIRGARFDPVLRRTVHGTHASRPAVEERVLYRITWEGGARGSEP